MECQNDMNVSKKSRFVHIEKFFRRGSRSNVYLIGYGHLKNNACSKVQGEI